MASEEENDMRAPIEGEETIFDRKERVNESNVPEKRPKPSNSAPSASSSSGSKKGMSPPKPSHSTFRPPPMPVSRVAGLPMRPNSARDIPDDATVASSSSVLAQSHSGENVSEIISGAHQRIKKLQSELDGCLGEINILRRDRDSLQIAVEELQGIIDSSVVNGSGMLRSDDNKQTIRKNNSVVGVGGRAGSPMGHGYGTDVAGLLHELQEKTKEFEQEKRSLYREMANTNRDKERALKLLICVIGKERVGKTLLENAGQSDILQVLIDTFGATSIDSTGSKKTLPSRDKSHI